MAEYDPTWDSLESHPIPRWFKDAKYGIYFHWGPYSVPAYGTEWYPREMYQEDTEIHQHHVETYDDPSEFGYKEFIPDFHGDDFDAEEWVALCKDAGAQYVGVTAIHHDGFAMWDSDITEWNAAEMGPERDVVGELAAAVRDHDMKFIAAFHHAWNWWYYPRKEGYDTMDPNYSGLYGQTHEEGEDPPEEYYERWRALTNEVVDEYQPDLLWFDFGWGNAGFATHDEYRRDVVIHYYNKAEEWGKEVGIAHKRNLPTGVGIQDYERSRREDLAVQPWLTDTSIDRSSWGYVEDRDYKDVSTLVTGFVDRLSKNGNTLMNVGPRPNGTIPNAAEEPLRSFGDWLAVNDEAIHGSRPWWTFGEGPTNVTSTEFEEASSTVFTSDDVRFIRSADGQVGYAVLMDWPADGNLTLETSIYHRLTGRNRADDVVAPESIELLGADIDLSWQIDVEANVLNISLPATAPTALDNAYTLRLSPP